MNSSQIIENKVDTAEKLAAAVGKPTKNFLFAAEINELVARIRLLWTLQNFDHSALIPAVKKDLGTLVGQTFIEKINTSAAVAYPSPCFVVYTIDGVEYVQGFVGAAGNYGTGQGQVTANQFVLLYQSDDVQTQPIPAKQEFIATYTGIFRTGYVAFLDSQIFTNSFGMGEVSFVDEFSSGVQYIKISFENPIISGKKIFYSISPGKGTVGFYDTDINPPGHDVYISLSNLTAGQPFKLFIKLELL